MKKEFKIVKDIAYACTKEVKRIIILAGISFTLFSTDVQASENPNFSALPQPTTVTEYMDSVPNSNIHVTLKSNHTSSSDMMADAYRKFQESYYGECEFFNKSFAAVENLFDNIKFSKVAIDGNKDENRIKIAFRLPDNAILSIIKEKGVHENNMVGFNLFRNRKLLISDVMDLSLLHEYILNVQARQQI